MKHTPILGLQIKGTLIYWQGTVFYFRDVDEITIDTEKTAHLFELSEEKVNRMAICVNACEGLSNEALEVRQGDIIINVDKVLTADEAQMVRVTAEMLEIYFGLGLMARLEFVEGLMSITGR